MALWEYRYEHKKPERRIVFSDRRFSAKDWQECPLAVKNIFLKNVDPQLIFLTGSSINGTVDEYSDIDLGVITFGRLPICEDICHVYWDGRHIHSFVHDLESFTRKRKTYIYCVGLFKANYLKAEHLLYVKDRKFAEDFLKNKDIPTGIGIHQFDDIFHEYIQGIVEDGADPCHGMPKFLATAVEIVYYLKKEPIEQNVGFINKVKRLYDKGLSDEDMTKLISVLSEYLRLVPEFRVKNSIEDFKSRWSSFREKYEEV